MWDVIFVDEKTKRAWSYSKVIHVNVRLGFISVVRADGFKAKVKNDEFTKCEITSAFEEGEE